MLSEYIQDAHTNSNKTHAACDAIHGEFAMLMSKLLSFCDQCPVVYCSNCMHRRIVEVLSVMTSPCCIHQISEGRRRNKRR